MIAHWKDLSEDYKILHDEILQMQPHFVAHLEVVWHSMLIMSLLVLSIGSVQDVMNLLVDVLNVLNEFVYLICLRLDMR